MFASLSTLAALLMLTSSASLVTANDEMMPFLSATCGAGEDMVDVTFDIKFSGNNADGNKINGNSKKIIEQCLKDTFNTVHVPSVICLDTVTINKLDIKPAAMSPLGDSLTSAGTYSISGSGTSYGGTCRRCSGMLGEPELKKWQIEFLKCLKGSGDAGVGGFGDDLTLAVTTLTTPADVSVNVAQDDDKVANDEMMPFLSAAIAADDDMVPITFDIKFTGTDANGDKINGNSKKIFEQCLKDTFNAVHVPSVIYLDTVTINKFEIKPMAMWLLRGSLTSAGTYSTSGGATSYGGTCRRCKRMLGDPELQKWQGEFVKCLQGSGDVGLVGFSDNLTLTVTTNEVAVSEN